MRATKKYGEDNQITNFGCPLTTNFQTEFCYPAVTIQSRGLNAGARTNYVTANGVRNGLTFMEISVWKMMTHMTIMTIIIPYGSLYCRHAGIRPLNKGADHMDS